jgi:thiol:disulfide interchange protein DsbD
METFRQLMAFPLYATVLWLLHVFSRQTAPEALWLLMTALLLLSMAAWTWGVSQRRPRGTRLLAAFGPLLAITAIAIAAAAVRAPRAQLAEAERAASRSESAFWQPWSPERVESLRAEGKPVFVNFTAEWCLSCQVNERVLFSSESVRELFRSYGVVALEADWTNEDARIAETLGSFGRDGVPLYVFYPSTGGAPRILPQVPTQASLKEAFASSQADIPSIPKENRTS